MRTNDSIATLSDLTIRFERRLAAPVARVWRAVTDADEMRAWFPSAVVGERTVGAPLAFPFDDNVADTFEGVVTKWEPERVFAFTWGGDQLRIELAPDGDATVLVFTQTLAHLTEAARTSSGWHACLASLDAHLGGPAADPETWKTCYPAYLDRMGPPLAERDGDALTWDRRHFVTPDALEDALAHPDAWGAPSDPDLSWTVSPIERGSAFCVRHATAATDPALAARWHALLTQLDMKLSAGEAVPADPELFLVDYEKLLAS